MSDEDVLMLGQINEALGGLIEKQIDQGSEDEGERPGKVFHITTDATTFQGYEVDEIKELVEVATTIIKSFPEIKEKKVGF